MAHTPEQLEIIRHQGDLRVAAGPGVGKTSTLVGYAQARPDKRILYIVFNRAMREEAVRKFKKARCPHVTVETLHSLAYRLLQVPQRYEVHPSGSWRAHEVIDLCHIPPMPDNQHLVLATHVLRLMARFCNGVERKLSDVDYLKELAGPESKAFVKKHIDTIQGAAHDMLARMYQRDLPLTHDAYLKFFQLSVADLGYDILCLDEAQDASPVMLDILTRQDRSVRVAVGDSHQQLYAFRYAVDSLEQLDFPQLTLSRSFRFGQDIADLAMESLEFKALIGQYPKPLRLIGAGNPTGRTTYAVISRSNLRLLDRAFHASVVKGEKQIHFEGGLKTYTYLKDGASLYDVLALHLGKTNRIQSDFIRQFRDTEELSDYIQEADDRELGLIIDMVRRYGGSLYQLISHLKNTEVPRKDATLFFATVHKSKGQEYDVVEVCDDFVNLETLLKSDHVLPEHKPQAQPKPKRRSRKQGRAAMSAAALVQEINMLYVAITRAQTEVLIPESIFAQPEDHDPYAGWEREAV